MATEVTKRSDITRELNVTEFDNNMQAIIENQTRSLENESAISAISQGTGETYTTRAVAMAVDPLPADNTPFVIFGEPGFNGQYFFNSAEVVGYSVVELFITKAEPGDAMVGSTKFSNDGQIVTKLTAERSTANKDDADQTKFAQTSMVKTVDTKTDFNKKTQSLIFDKSSTFISDATNAVSLGETDKTWLNDFFKSLQIYGYNYNEKITPYFVKKNDSGTYQIDFYKDTGDGTGTTKTLLMSWSSTSYTPTVGGYDTISVRFYGGIGFDAVVNWNAISDWSSVTGRYNYITSNTVKLNSSVFPSIPSAKYPFDVETKFISNAAGYLAGNSRYSERDFRWMQNFLIDLKLDGFEYDDKVTLFLVRKEVSELTNRYQLQFFKDTGDGSGSSKVSVLDWDMTDYIPPTSGIDLIEFQSGDYSFKAVVNWNKVGLALQGGMNYNSAKLSERCFVNFSTAATDEPMVSGLVWQYNNADATTTGTDLFSQFTVVANVDGSSNTLGCTGLSYNTDTDEYIVSEYGYAISSKLLFYKRNALTAYNSSGTITPTPTRVIDVQTHGLYHIQGNCYDPTTKTYWVLGSYITSPYDSHRLLIRVDDENNLIESFRLNTSPLNYSFQSGMIAMSPDFQNLLIKPNNKTELIEIDKVTKELVRTVTDLNLNEGLGIDYENSIVWIGGDNGELKKYNYSDFVQIGSTINFESLNDGGTDQNIEGILIDPIDGSLVISADAYLHGSHNNGNCLFFYDFDKNINKKISFPNMYNFGTESGILEGSQTWVSPIFDFDTFDDYQTNAIQISSQDAFITVEYRGSNTAPVAASAPTSQKVTRVNWRDRPTFASWGTTTPSAYTTSVPNFRYVQIKIIISN